MQLNADADIEHAGRVALALSGVAADEFRALLIEHAEALRVAPPDLDMSADLAALEVDLDTLDAEAAAPWREVLVAEGGGG